MLVTLLIVGIFIIFAVLMYLKKISAMFALPLMAFLIALVAGVPFADVVVDEVTQPGIINLLFAAGPVRLASAIMIVIFGSILSQLLNNTGVAESMVRKVSELAGDRPFIIAIAFYAIGTLLFTTLGGLGSVIMVGSIILPIMISVGIKPLISASILLFALSTGGIFNFMNWGLYESTFGLTIEEITSFAWVLGAIFIVVSLVFIYIEVKRDGSLSSRKKTAWSQAAPAENTEDENKVNILAMLTPIIPLVLVLVFKFDIIGSFVVAIIYLVLTTMNKKSMSQLSQAVIEGISNSAGAIFLMIGIGMLLVVVMDPRVTAHIGEPMANILPSTKVGYIVFFSILAPLALYRGPLNVWGLGLGIGALMILSGKLSGMALMAALMSTGQLQGISDPTNTHNIWAASTTGVDINDILRKTLPYVWVGAIVGLILATFIAY